jgi:hypothetical protein
MNLPPFTFRADASLAVPLPDLVTHRYDPAVGVCPDVCSLTDTEAERVLDRLRRTTRPTLKATYLARRRTTERWLSGQARKVLSRPAEQGPGFLGDFSHATDAFPTTRPVRAALDRGLRQRIVQEESLPARAMTSTLGDSMTVAE